jgi:hypothetical protein
MVRGLQAERIYNSDLAVLLTGTKIFGIDDFAPANLRGSKDERIEVANSKPRGELQSKINVRNGDRSNLLPLPELDPRDGFLSLQWSRPSCTCNRAIEFSKDLR